MEPPVADPTSCRTIADFTTAVGNEQWLVVNDNVMGGQSLGGRTFANGTMTFSGSINTDGGGFSSLRLLLDQGSLANVEYVEVTARSDGRDYMVTFDDALEGRNRRVSFRAPLVFASIGEWETVTVRLADLYPAIFGQRVDAVAFRPDLATRIGIMQSDGIDGEFRLEIDSIEACGPTSRFTSTNAGS